MYYLASESEHRLATIPTLSSVAMSRALPLVGPMPFISRVYPVHAHVNGGFDG